MYTLTIYVTNICNLNCNYCFVSKNNKKYKLKWGENIEKTIISFIETKWRKKKISIMWWEPLLNIEFLTKLVLFIRKIKQSYKNKYISFAPIPTNWTIYNEQFYILLKDNDIELRFSIDEQLDNNSNHRIDLNNESINYWFLYDNLKLYKEIFWVFPWVRTVVTNDNVDSLYDIVNYFIYQLWIIDIHIWVSHGFNLDFILYNKYTEQYAKIFDFYIKIINSWVKISINPIEFIIVDCFKWWINNNSIFNNRNQVCWMWNEVAISFDWNIYSCDLIAWADYVNKDFKNKYLIWNINTKIDYTKPKKDLWNKILPSFSVFWKKIWINRKICFLFDSKTMKFNNLKNYIIMYKINYYIYDYIMKNLNKINSNWIRYIRDKYWLYWSNKWIFN